MKIIIRWNIACLTILAILLDGSVAEVVQKVFDNDINESNCCAGNQRSLAAWQGSWAINPTTASWTVQTHIPLDSDFENRSRQERGKFKVKKKFKKFMLPLLLAYKLKFFTLIPVLIGGLVLLTGATGMAGFFFALFAAVMGLKGGGH